MLEHFKKLTPGEAIQFKKFVSSPYFNTNRKVTLLGNYLCSRHPDLTPEVLKGRVIYRFVFRNQKYNDNNFRKLVSDFNSVFKRFLTEIELEESIQLRNYLLLNKYNKLKITGKIKHVHKEAIDADSKFIEKDLYYYINLFLTEYFYYPYAVNDSTKERLKSFDRLSKFADWLIINIKLDLYHRENGFYLAKPQNFKPKYTLKKEIYNLVETSIEEIKKKHPLMLFFYYSSRIEEHDNSYFPEFEKFYNKNKELLKERFHELYVKTYFNYYYDLFVFSNNKDEAARKIFRFLNYYYLINDPVDELMEGGHIPCTIIYATLAVSKHLNRLSWAEKLIEKNMVYLPEAYRRQLYFFAKGVIQFNKRNYKTALDWFSKITGNTLPGEHNKRILTIMIYYEMQEFEGIKSQLINLRTLMNNKNTSEKIAKIIKDFLKYFNMLIKIRNLEKRNRREEIIMIKNTLVKENPLGFKIDWFTEKIGEL